MKLTLEALYTLHMMNEQSDDLVFLPCPNRDLDRKEQLKKTVLKGYEDLKESGLIVDDKPTDECIRMGVYLSEYQDAKQQICIDEKYYCAPGVAVGGNQSVLLQRISENEFEFDRMYNILFLSILIQTHPLLQELQTKRKNYLHSYWEGMGEVRFLSLYHNHEGLRLMTAEEKQITGDTLYVDSEDGIWEYKWKEEMIRSISGEDLRDLLIHLLQVKE